MQRFLNISTRELQISTSFSADFQAVFVNKEDEIYLGVHKIHETSLRLCLRLLAAALFLRRSTSPPDRWSASTARSGAVGLTAAPVKPILELF
jgi:hypothetical protein